MISGNGTAGTLGTIFRHQRQGAGGGDMIIFTNPSLTGTPLETARFTSDQKVGIGLSAPVGKLHVSSSLGDAYFEGYSASGRFAGIQFLNTANSNGDVVAAVNADRDGANDAGALTFDTQPGGGGMTEAMRITSAQKVGIGSTSPSQKLDVVGAVSASTYYGDGSNLQNVTSVAGAAGPQYSVQFNNTGTAVTGSSQFIFNPSNNRLGIGTNNPQNQVHISGNTNANLEITTGTAGLITLQSLNDARNAYEDLRLYGDNVILNANAAGKTGIGTASPITKLQVHDQGATLGLWAHTAIGIHNDTNNNTYSQLGFGFTGTTNNAPAVIAYHNQSATAYGQGSLVFGLRNSTSDAAPTERMRIQYDGNVGIGTTSPTAYLHVSQSSTGNTAVAKFVRPDGSNASNYMVDIINADTTSNQGAGLNIQAGNDSGDSTLNVANRAGASAIRVLGDGKVGIGTTTPLGNKLHIHVGDSGVCLLYTSPSPRDLSTSRMPSSA